MISTFFSKDPDFALLCMCVYYMYTCIYTSECPPGESNLSQALHLRQVGCQSFPRDDLRSADMGLKRWWEREERERSL